MREGAKYALLRVSGDAPVENTDVLEGKKAEVEQVCIGNKRLCLCSDEDARALLCRGAVTYEATFLQETVPS